MAEKKGYVATTKFLIASPTKVRPVANVIKRKSCSEAVAILDNMPQKGARLIQGTLKSAVANALNKNKKLMIMILDQEAIIILILVKKVEYHQMIYLNMIRNF